MKYFLCAILIGGLWMESFAAGIDWGVVRRGARFVQVADAPPQQIAPVPVFAAEIVFRANPVFVSAIDSLFPDGRIVSLEHENALPGYFWSGDYPSEAQLGSGAPTGAYFFESTDALTDLGTVFFINVPAPTVDTNLAPLRVSNWSAAQRADSSQEVRIEFDLKGVQTLTDHVQLTIAENFGGLVFATGIFPGDPGSVITSSGVAVVPRGALVAGHDYVASLSITRLGLRDTKTLPGATLAAAHFAETFFELKTVKAGGGTGVGLLQIVTEALPLGVPGQPYQATLSVQGGTPPYRWSLGPASDPLPEGLTLDAGTGVIRGTTRFPDLSTIVVRATDAANAVAEQTLFLFTLPGDEPVIWLDPLSETVEVGDDVVLEVFATGAEPLSYQWQFNGTAIPGATDPFLDLVAVTPAFEGNFTVVVRNALGTVTSRAARISVLTPPEIVRQPQSQTAALNQRVEFSVQVAGAGPFRYQWQLNGEDIPGATASQLVLASVQARDSGDYSVVVEGPDGAINSEDAELRVEVPALRLTDRFADRISINTAQGSGRGSNLNATREAGEPFHAGFPGGRSVWIEWVAPASGIATFGTRGSDFDTVLAVYTGASLQTLREEGSDEDSGEFFSSEVKFNAVEGIRYAIAVDGFFFFSGDVVLNWKLEATSGRLPVIRQQPRDQIVSLGRPARFSVVAANVPPETSALRYQWFRNGVAINGAVAAEFAIGSTALGDLGLYQVTVQNGVGTAASDLVLLLSSEVDGILDVAVSAEDKFANAIPLGAPRGLAGFRKTSFAPGTLDPSGTAAARGYSGTQIFNSFGSTTEEGEPNHCGVIGGASQWFSYQAEADGLLRVSTEGSDFDTVLAVYTGSGADFQSLKLQACDNDGGLAGRTSVVRLNAKAGTLYFIAVDGVRGATGNVRLTYQLDGPPKLSMPRIENGQVKISAPSQPGRAYSLQISSDMVKWTTLHLVNATGTTVDFTDNDPNRGAVRFYRVFAGR